MRGVAGGPDIPPSVLQCLEDGQLVFFCGAGVSCRAGLPTFRKLVELIYAHLNADRPGQEEAEFQKRNFDRVLGLLEERTQLGRRLVRRTVLRLLQVPSSADLDTHKALLTLSTVQDGACRLVTTNFDRAFELAGPGIPLDSAPKLPVPKKERWRGIVHLHGRLSEEDPEGETLVLTSADFGLAYLTERWASRFVSELFRRFSVVFVGYSVDDPVMRYMMDALAADRALGESVGKAYALVGCNEGQYETVAAEWTAKGVVPILYDQRDDHTLLHQTLRSWADCHRLGLLGRESIVVQHGGTRPYQDDPVVSQVVWAIQEPSGRVARVFAEREPLPPAEWLDVFDEQGLLALPCPDAQRLPVPLAGGGLRAANPPPLNPVTRALGDWLTRHFDSPRVQHWAIDTGGCLHPEMRMMVRRRLERPECALPASLRLFWQLVSSDLCEGARPDRSDAFDLAERLKTGSWDFLIKDELLSALTPCLRLGRPGPLVADVLGEDTSAAEPAGLGKYVNADVVLRVGDEGTWLVQNLRQSPNRDEALVELLDDLTSLLKRAMELHAVLGHANKQYDSSHRDWPSIAPHPQNTWFPSWVLLIELARDSLQATAASDRAQARRQVERWKSLGFPVFRRLTLHAMAQSSLFDPEESLGYLLEDDAWWLWSPCTQREMFRLLNSVCLRLTEPGVARLLDSTLAGPPRRMFRSDLPDEDFASLCEQEIWLRLEKLQHFGNRLQPRGTEVLEALRAKHSDWQLQAGDRDEFTSWMKSGEGAGPPSPPVSRECLEWPDDVWKDRLAATPIGESLMGYWRLLLREQFDRAAGILLCSAESHCWPADAWEALLEFAAVDTRWQNRWQELSVRFGQAREDIVERLVRPAARLLQHVSETLPVEAESSYWPLWERAAGPAFATPQPSGRQPLDAAWNTPAGHLTQALLNRISLARPQQRDDLSAEMWTRLDRLATGVGGSYPTARVLLASRLLLLHTLDPSWAETTLIWRFDWETSEEAPALWQGFLWQPRRSPELWSVLKASFLKTPAHFQQLGDRGSELCRLVAAICIGQPGWIADGEAKDILRSLGSDGRKTVAVHVWRWLVGAAERAEALWAERVGPWLTKAWPKDRVLVEPDSAKNLALAAIASCGAFESAVNTVEPLLTPVEHYFSLVDRLRESAHPEAYPGATLKLLSLTVPPQCPLADPQLREVLDRVAQAQPALRDSPQYRALDDFLRRHNLP